MSKSKSKPIVDEMPSTDEEILQDAFLRIEKSYEIMNWYASGESMNLYSRVDPQAILGEVYFILAPVHERLKYMVAGGNAGTPAYAWYKEQLAVQRADMQKEINEIRNLADEAKEEIEKKANARIENAEAECHAQIAATKDQIAGHIRKAVEKAIIKTREKFRGKPLEKTGRSIRL